MSSEEEELEDEVEGPVSAFVHLRFWEESTEDEEREEPLHEYTGYSIPIPNVGDRVDLFDFQVSDMINDENGDKIDENASADEIVDRLTGFEVVDVEYTYANVDLPEEEGAINPPYVIVSVILDDVGVSDGD